MTAMGNPLIAAYDVNRTRLREVLADWVGQLDFRPRATLLVPPDHTRCYSWAGPITAFLYELLAPFGRVEILPALGTHLPMTADERRRMFGSTLPENCFLTHDWRRDVRALGEIPGNFLRELSDGLFDEPVQVGINRIIIDGGYDLVVSIGQVVPHEVVGMANHNKNILVGCGGKDLIDKSHFLGAVCGIENILGQAETPVRRLFDEAERRFLGSVPLHYIQTVTSIVPDAERLHAVFIGRGREPFTEAARESRRMNITLLDRPLAKVVVYLDPEHFRSTWLGNKAIYRSRMAIADGGELMIIAPGLRQFGEDGEIDRLIRTYGYGGTSKILRQVAGENELRTNLSAAAHLIHGSTEDRFRVTYATAGLSREEINGVGFGFIRLDEALRHYHPETLKPGINRLSDGEELYFIDNPGLGLWSLRERFIEEKGGAADHG